MENYRIRFTGDLSGYQEQFNQIFDTYEAAYDAMSFTNWDVLWDGSDLDVLLEDGSIVIEEIHFTDED